VRGEYSQAEAGISHANSNLIALHISSNLSPNFSIANMVDAKIQYASMLPHRLIVDD
jgi:hypothetical protein